MTTKTKIICILIVSILTAIIVGQCTSNYQKNQEIALYEHNMNAFRDSMKTLKLKNGELLAEKTAYILNEKQMMEQINMSKSEINDLQNKLNASIDQITKIQSTIKLDTIQLPGNIIYVNKDTLLANFDYYDQWMNMSGEINYKSPTCTTTIYNICMDVPLTVGMTDQKQFFVTSSNPYVQFTDITSVINEKTIQPKKRWGIGFNIGPGLYYDLIHNKFGAGIGGQLGINYNF